MAALEVRVLFTMLSTWLFSLKEDLVQVVLELCSWSQRLAYCTFNLNKEGSYKHYSHGHLLETLQCLSSSVLGNKVMT